jgi:hypothetical protein
MVKQNIFFLILISINIISCTTNIQDVDSKIEKKEISSQLLLKMVFEKNLDTSITEVGNKIILIAKNNDLTLSEDLISTNKNYILYTDTITFNKILEDSLFKKRFLPVFTEKRLTNEESIITFVLFDKEICYDFTFDKNLNHLNTNKYQMNFKYKYPFNN